MFCYDYLQVVSLFSYANTKSFCRSLKNLYTNLERKKFIRIKLLVIYILWEINFIKEAEQHHVDKTCT